MTDPLLLSRRSFLAGLGASGAALAARPTIPALFVVPPEAPAPAVLPLNVLHVWRDREWRAVGSILEAMKMVRYDDHMVENSRGERFVARGPQWSEFDLTLPWSAEGVHLLGADVGRKERFAVSLSGVGYEFDGGVGSILETVRPGDARLGCQLFALGKVESRILED